MTSTSIHTSSNQLLESDLCRAVVFTIENHLLALPLPAVLKVVSKSIVQSNYSNTQPIVYLENQPLTLLNLHPYLSKIPSPNLVPPPVGISGNETSGQFLLIAKLQNFSQWAIPIDQPPILLDLPLSTVRLLPPTYRLLIQNLAQHVAVVNQDRLLTILLLNLNRAAGALSSDNSNTDGVRT